MIKNSPVFNRPSSRSPPRYPSNTQGQNWPRQRSPDAYREVSPRGRQPYSTGSPSRRESSYRGDFSRVSPNRATGAGRGYVGDRYHPGYYPPYPIGPPAYPQGIHPIHIHHILPMDIIQDSPLVIHKGVLLPKEIVTEILLLETIYRTMGSKLFREQYTKSGVFRIFWEQGAKP